MQFAAIIIMLLGGFFLDSAVKNRSPKALVAALVKDPSNLRGTINSLNGQWVQETGNYTKDQTVIYDGSKVGAGNKALGVVKNGLSLAGVTSVNEVGNSGNLNDSQLSRIAFAPSHRLVPKAARSLEALDAQYMAAFGTHIPISDSYRSFASQVQTKALKGNLAATPGKSVHGWGRALDLRAPLNNDATAQHKWLVANGPKYGWVWPSWARRGAEKYEPWHFEYQGA